MNLLWSFFFGAAFGVKNKAGRDAGHVWESQLILKEGDTKLERNLSQTTRRGCQLQDSDTGCVEKKKIYTKTLTDNVLRKRCECIECEQSYELMIYGECEECQSDAIDGCCKHPSTHPATRDNCLKCKHGFQIDHGTKEPLPDVGSCHECEIENCQKLEFSPPCKCMTCKQGFENSDGLCQECSPVANCEYFAPNSCQCEKCNAGFKKDDNTCNECVRECNRYLYNSCRCRRQRE